MELLEDGEVRFYRPDGRLVPNVPPRPPVEDDAEARLRHMNDRPGLDIGPWTATPDWHGERFDLHYGLWTLRGQFADDPGVDHRGRDEPGSDDPENANADPRNVDPEADPDADGGPTAHS